MRIIDRHGRVHDDGVKTAVLHVLVRRGFIFVAADVGDAGFGQRLVGIRAAQRTDRVAARVFKVADAGGIALGNDHLQVSDVVGNGEVDRLLPLRSHLDAVDGDVVKTALHAGDEDVPDILHELGFQSHFSRQRLGDFGFEARQFFGLGRVVQDKGHSSLGVAAPSQHCVGHELGGERA